MCIYVHVSSRTNPILSGPILSYLSVQRNRDIERWMEWMNGRVDGLYLILDGLLLEYDSHLHSLNLATAASAKAVYNLVFKSPTSLVSG